MHKYEELENRWKQYSMKKKLKLYLYPSLLVLVGFALYYITFVFMNTPSEPSLIAQSQTTQLSESKTKPSKQEAAPKENESVLRETVPQQTALKPEPTPEKEPTQSASTLTRPDTSVTPVVQNTVPATPLPQTAATPLTQAPQSPIPEKIQSSESIASLSKTDDPPCYTISVPVLNIRIEPYIGAQILGKYRQNDVVCEFERRQGWIKGEFGWVYAKSLVPVQPNSSESLPIPSQSTQTAPSQNPTSLANLIAQDSLMTPPVTIDIKKHALSEDEKIALLIKRFEAEKKDTIALELSKIFFEQQNYKEARKWAYSANKQNAQNSETWILFAKSAHALGEKEQAIKALETLLLQMPDINEARKLLMQYRSEMM